jgi:mannose-6-phosphate isomerase-like protein (cupin superfamily)
MITKLSASSEDKAKLRSLQVDSKQLKNDFLKYEGLIIRKPWGYEYLAFENEYVAMWVLYIQHGFQTSLHCHPNKKSSLTVLSGEALCTTLGGAIKVRPGKGLLIDRGTFHSTRALSKNGIVVMEVETPVNKRDLVRLDDKYGRKDKGYEGKESHVNLDEPDYQEIISFHELESRYNTPKTVGVCTLHMIHCPKIEDLRKYLKNAEANLVSVMRGKIYNGKTLLFEPGDIVTMQELKQAKDLDILDGVELLFITI